MNPTVTAMTATTGVPSRTDAARVATMTATTGVPSRTDAARVAAMRHGWWRPVSWIEPAPDRAMHGGDRDHRGAQSGWCGAGRRGESPLPFWALNAFTFILLVAPQTFVPGLVPALAFIRPALLAVVLSVGTLVTQRMLLKRPITVLTREMWLAGGLLVLALITIPFSYWPGGSASFLAGIFAKSLAVFWLMINVLSTPERIHRFIVVLSLLGAPLAATALWNYRSGLFIEGALGVQRIAGYDAPLTQNPNDLALMLNLLVPLAVGLLLARPGRLLATALVCTIALEVAGIVVTFSRAGFLALATTTLVCLWQLRRRRLGGWALLILAIGIASLPFLPGGYGKRLATVMNVSADRTGSAQARWQDTVAAARYVAKNPIMGAGIGQDILALNEERGLRWRSVHNVFLQHAVELGLPGILLFVLLLGSCWKAAAAVERRRDAGRLAALATGVKMSLLAFIVAGLFHPAGYHFYFYYVAGLAVALELVTRPEPPAPALGGRR